MALDLEGKGGVEEMQFVGLEADFVADPGKSGPQIKGIDVQKLILLFAEFLAQVFFVLKEQNQVGCFHDHSSKMLFETRAAG